MKKTKAYLTNKTASIECNRPHWPGTVRILLVLVLDLRLKLSSPIGIRKGAVHVSVSGVMIPVGRRRGECRLRQPRGVSFDRGQVLNPLEPDAADWANHS